jgi:DNA-binding SARP family transcriptional activator
LVGEVKLGTLAIEHRKRTSIRRGWDAVESAVDAGLAARLKPWIRRYTASVDNALARPNGAVLLARLAAADPDGWRGALVHALEGASPADRQTLLGAIALHADRQTIEAMARLSGNDVAATRRQIQQLRASRLFLRTFGGVSLHRGDWSGPALPIEKKRVRMLLAVLAAGTKGTLTRDLAIELLWPDADPDAGVNSLNQTVFQLRRYIDPGYRGGFSPEYVVSTSELVALDRELVRTDLDEIRRLPQRLAGADWAQRQSVAKRVVSLVRGEFLADLRYESWSSVQQIGVHNEVRELLLPIASDGGTDFETQVSVLAASALISIDPYDEEAVISLARSLARSGRRVAARDLVIDYVRRLQAEIDDELSSSLIQAADSVGAGAHINSHLTTD